ncbi:hypothetical protein FHS43_005314 [Streptosporangium becharense]|uniref:Uncharacterized protein n=1 Tax=Streptosporangium becharense TaxID=1816182 RepID=A0A7W9IJS8_9ACTN|nr:enediyne biosynthesis protein UnbU [Streptosporangium becharense]MBB2914005.1 hypothetical protein [Streptosporangium becharense]MBB5821334.1 hypothetical protein [Streptosporangium becharense]
MTGNVPRRRTGRFPARDTGLRPRGHPGRGRRNPAPRRAAAAVTLLTLLGHTLLGFEQPLLAPVVGALTGVATASLLETVDAWARRRPARCLGPRDETAGFLLPSYTCGLLCAMLLHTGAHPAPVALATLIGVGSAYAVRVRVAGTTGTGDTARTPARTGGDTPGAPGAPGEIGPPGAPGAAGAGGDVPGTPFMNPSNTGVVAALLLFPWVGVAPPYQFTAWVSGPFDVIVPLAVLAAGLAASRPAGTLPLVAGWAGGFALQAFVRGGLGEVSVAAALLPMTGTAFAVHTAHVLADPVAAPRTPRGQVAFGMAAAAVYGLLVELGVGCGLFLSLALVCAGRGLALAVRARIGPSGVSPAPARGRQPMPGPTRSSTRREPSCRTSSNAPEASARR